MNNSGSFFLVLCCLSIFGIPGKAQTPGIFENNQRLFVDKHIQFAYYDYKTTNRVKSSVMTTIRWKNGKPDTTGIMKMEFDTKGRVVHISDANEDFLVNDGYKLFEHSYFSYDQWNNVTTVTEKREILPDEGLAFLMLKYDMKKERADKEQLKKMKALEREIRARGQLTPTLHTTEIKKFLYDANGNLIYYHNPEVGYAVVVEYKLDEQKRLVEITSQDTNEGHDVKTINQYRYDNENRITYYSKVMGNISKDGRQTFSKIQSEETETFSYNPQGDYLSVSRKSGTLAWKTTNFACTYGADGKLKEKIVLKGSDTVEIVTYSYENNLLRKEVRHSNRPEENGMNRITEYTYYPNKEIKQIGHFTSYPDEKPSKNPDQVDFFEFTYY